MRACVRACVCVCERVRVFSGMGLVLGSELRVRVRDLRFELGIRAPG